MNWKIILVGGTEIFPNNKDNNDFANLERVFKRLFTRTITLDYRNKRIVIPKNKILYMVLEKELKQGDKK